MTAESHSANRGSIPRGSIPSAAIARVGRNLELRFFMTGILHRHWMARAFVAVLLIPAMRVFAGAYLPVYGSPLNATNSFETAATAVNDSGQAVGFVNNVGVRWGSSGGIVLGNLPNNPSLPYYTYPAAINSSGMIAGAADRIVNDTVMGYSPTVWDASGKATALSMLGTSSIGRGDSQAVAVNAGGLIVGYAEKYDSGGNLLGRRAMRWDASGNGTELGILALFGGGSSAAQAYAVNNTGMIVGTAAGPGTGSPVAVRWDAGGNAIQMGNLGTDSMGNTSSQPTAINSSGVSVGFCTLYNPVGPPGNLLGRRPVRWDASGNITELPGLGKDPSGVTYGQANGINDRGVIFGDVDSYDASGKFLGFRSVRWDSAGNQTILGALPVLPTETIITNARAINSAGIIVGNSTKDLNNQAVQRAVLWDASGNVTDLNSLIDPKSGWTLVDVRAISDTGWITGLGYYNDPITRTTSNELYLIQVPEPSASLLLIASGLLYLCARPSRLPTADEGIV
jgi:hypothetical protein